MPNRPASRRGFTLLEGLLSIVVIAIIAALTLPVVSGATENYAEASAARRATESAAFAMERAVRFLREVPAGVDPTTLGISSATGTEIVCTDGTSLRMSGDQLMLTTSSSAGEGVLLSGVQAFEIRYLGKDGTTSTLSSPGTTHRFEVTIRTGGAELRCAAFPRVRMVPQ